MIKHLIYAMIAIFLLGYALITHADSRHKQPDININNSYSYSDSTCAVAGAAGLHQFKISPKLQGSLSAANCDYSSAVSFAIAKESNGLIYSLTGAIDDQKDENVFVGAAMGWTFN